MGNVRAYAYGCKIQVVGGSVSEEDLFDHFRAVNQYRNGLVEIELDRRDKREKRVQSLLPSYKKTQKQIAQSYAAIEQLEKKRNAIWQKERKKVRVPEIQQALKAEKEVLVAAKRKATVLRKKHITNKKSRVARALTTIDTAANVKEKVLYNDTFSDLFWGTKVFALDNHKQVKKSVNPRFRAFRGESTLMVQLQDKNSDKEVLGSGNSYFQINPVPDTAWEPGNRKQQWTFALFRIRPCAKARDNSEYVCLKMRYHRPLPAGSVVKRVCLKRTRTGTVTRYNLILFIEHETAFIKTDVAESGTAHVDIGFRMVKEGLLVARVGEAMSKRGEGVNMSGCTELVIPHAKMSEWKKSDDLQQICDLEFNRAAERFVQWRRKHKIPKWLRADTKAIKSWRNHVHLVRLVNHWRENRFAGDTAMFQDLEGWVMQDRHLFNYDRGRNRRMQNWRQDLYRNFAATLRRKYRNIIIPKKIWCIDQSLKGHFRIYARRASCGMLVEILKNSGAIVKECDPVTFATVFETRKSATAA